MSSAVEIRPVMAAPGRVGQGTAVEQSRAIAEVHAAIVVAQQIPRNIDRAVRDMHRSCGQKSLAERAFFRYNRAGSQITGPSVQLARELIRCWGNAQYGLVELRRDDTFGQSEMQAWAWDVETNTRNSTTFIVPHLRDTRDGAKALTDMRDIYENNANMGARRLREMIFAILPGWYTEDAIADCYRTLEQDDGDGTLAERISAAVDGFAALGVTPAQMEQKLGAPGHRWTPYDLAQLQVIYRSLKRGEATVEEEFPSQRVTVTEITGNGKPAAAAPAQEEKRPKRQAAEPATPAAAPAGQERPEPHLSTGQVNIIRDLFTKLDVTGEDEILNYAAILAGADGLTALSDLTQEQGQRVQRQLSGCRGDRVALIALTATKNTTTENGGTG